MRIEFDVVMDLVYLVVDGVTVDFMTKAEYESEFGFKAMSELLRAS
jgi:hypothetical protein